MKKFLIGFICGLLIMTGGVFAATELSVIANPFPVLINGVESVVEGYNIDGFTFLKLADFKQAGIVVKFNETDRQIEITSDASNSVSLMSLSTDIVQTDLTVPEITIGIGKTFTINGKTITLDAKTINDYGITNITASNGFSSEFSLDLDIEQYKIGDVPIVKYNGIEYVVLSKITKLKVNGLSTYYFLDLNDENKTISFVKLSTQAPDTIRTRTDNIPIIYIGTEKCVLYSDFIILK